MARDDYHVIAYRILAYLYARLKAGEDVDGDLLRHDSSYLNINETYWAYIFENLSRDGLIEGIIVSHPFSGGTMIDALGDAQITPRGIEYLCDNSFLNKAKEFLEDAKAIVPFI